ncbi:MAG: hypothetical protein BroJett022_09370 [Actinomycetes bacterium]|nr:MAG: hypothetical protein BroJett022_09370 [Actinomycetes bacterium]
MSEPSDRSGGGAAEGAEQLTPEQEQMLRQMEEEMRKVRVQDLVAQSVVSIINLAYRRIAKEDERDLEQARIGIEAVRGLVDLLEEDARHEIRNALSQLQVLYARQAGGGAPGQPPEGGPEAPAQPRDPGAAGGAKPPPRLWTPGSD